MKFEKERKVATGEEEERNEKTEWQQVVMLFVVSMVGPHTMCKSHDYYV